MIEARELRIGNLVKLPDEWFTKNPELSATEPIIKVDKINYDLLFTHRYLVNHYNISDLSPIELTEEWLIKFGYTKEDEYFYDKEKETRLLQSKISPKVFSFEMAYSNTNDDSEKWVYMNSIHYLHQLQNLFFCLCGEELEIKG